MKWCRESAGASGNRYVPATEVIQLLTKRNPPANIALMILAGGFNVAGKLSKTH